MWPTKSESEAKNERVLCDEAVDVPLPESTDPVVFVAQHHQGGGCPPGGIPS